MISRFALAALALVTVSITSTLVGCSGGADDVGESEDELTGGRIVVRHFDAPGPSITKWGYDIKQEGRSRAMKPALADEIFNQIGMNLLRIPVRAAEAHPSAGVANIRGSAYADDLDAIKIVKAANASVDVFASVKLDGKQSFPAWVKNGGGVDADKYSVLLENFLEYMSDHGVAVDWLGMDNESKFNEGNITPAKYNAIVVNVTGWCKQHGVKVPGFIAGEDYGPTEDTPWLKSLWQTGAQFDHVDHVGVHIYSKHRDGAYVDAMTSLSKNVHGKGLWDSELHWNDLQKDGDVRFDDLKVGMLTAFDHFDVGFHALSWWAFQPKSNGNKAAHIMSELVNTTVGAATLPTDDMDGKTLGMQKFNSRAFKSGAKEVTLWVANYDKDQTSQKTEIQGQRVASAAYVQWSSSSANAGKAGAAKASKKDPSTFTMSFPANTITRVVVTLQ